MGWPFGKLLPSLLVSRAFSSTACAAGMQANCCCGGDVERLLATGLFNANASCRCGKQGLVNALPLVPKHPSTGLGQIALAKAILAKYNLDYISAFVVGPRELRHNIALAYDKTDPDDEKRADACYRELVMGFGDKGWAGDRAGVQAMDLVAAQYGDTNRSINATIKNALDPNHILAPGKFGIA